MNHDQDALRELLAKQVAELTARNAELESKARRYDWIAEQTTVTLEEEEDMSIAAQEAWDIVITGGNEPGALDAAIDKAMKESE